MAPVALRHVGSGDQTADDAQQEGAHTSGWWTRLAAHAMMFFVASSFGGYNVLLAGITSFPVEMTLREKYCRQSAFMTYRIGGAATLFVLGAIASGTWLRLPVDRWHAAHLVAQGVFGIWVVQYLFLLGVGRTSPNIGAVMAALTPVAVCIAAVALRMEKLTWRKSLGMLVGVGGAFVTLGSGVFSGGVHTDEIGCLVLLACLFSGAGYCLLLRSFATNPRYTGCSTSYEQTAWQQIVGATCMGVTSCYCWDEPNAFLSPGPPTKLTWVTVGYAIVVASSINYWIQAWAAKHLEASTLGVYGLVQPFATAIFAFLAFGTAVSLPMILGTAMVGAAILLIAWQQAIDEAAELASTKDTEGEDQPLLRGAVN